MEEYSNLHVSIGKQNHSFETVVNNLTKLLHILKLLDNLPAVTSLFIDFLSVVFVSCLVPWH